MPNRKTRRVVFVGSTNFPLDVPILAQVVDVLRDLGPGVVILTRGSDGFDQFVMYAAVTLGLRVLRYPSRGGSDNWDRDVEMVGDATEVHGFVSLEDLEVADKTTGTIHVIEQAQNRKLPTKAYTVVDGQVVFVGET